MSISSGKKFKRNSFLKVFYKDRQSRRYFIKWKELIALLFVSSGYLDNSFDAILNILSDQLNAFADWIVDFYMSRRNRDMTLPTALFPPDILLSINEFKWRRYYK